MSKFESGNNGGEPRPRRHSTSLFGPIFLIALGLYFLATNLGFAPDLHWGAVWRLWPLFLVFAGLNVIVRQMPRPFGTLGSASVGLLAVIVFGGVLFFADRIPALQRYSGTEPTFQTETISFPASEIRTADITIDFAAPQASLFALSDSTGLIAGEVSYQGTLQFDHEVNQGHASINLETTSNSTEWFNWLNPANWSGEGMEWRLGLNPRIPTNLILDFASGSISADLSRLNLTNLEVDGSSGSATLLLPDGDYTMDYDMSSGSVQMTLPSAGQATFIIEGSSGSVTLLLPESMAMRVTVDSSSGSFQPGRRLEQISGNNDLDVWQTPDYEDATDRLDIQLDMSSGSIRIGEP
jgi:hypothetical protein